MNLGRSLFSMHSMLLGYSFRPNSHMLATAGSVMTIDLSIADARTRKKTSLMRENKIDWSRTIIGYSGLKGLTQLRLCSNGGW